MQKPIRKIGLIVFLILVLPISAFFIYQFTTFNESEREINKIYIQQLETILYSINQYSEDVVSSWVNEININFTHQKQNIGTDYKRFLNNNSSIKNIFIVEDSLNNLSTFVHSNDVENNISQDSVMKILNDKKHIAEKLQNYLKLDYQKIESIGKISGRDHYLCLFAIKSKNGSKNIGGIIFDPDRFIQQNLSLKISQACGDEFVLAIVDINNSRLVHSCDRIDVSEIILEKPLWLLPGLSLGIKMKSGSVQELISQRFSKNLIILGFLLFILIIGIFLIYYNIRKELQLTQLKSDFISNVSHELRTPLSLINMYSETLVLNRIQSEEKKREYYSVIQKETIRLSKIVNSILNFSKMEAGTRKYVFEDCNLLEITKEVIGTYDYHIKSKGFSYIINSTEKIKNIVADKDAISESIINLIENTIKYSEERKKFEIKLGSNNYGPYWEIKDFGIGISSDDQNKIFDKFYRVSSGLVYNTKGTGLGLSLVKQIMDAHKGEVIVKSIIGSGSTFRLQFNFTKK